MEMLSTTEARRRIGLSRGQFRYLVRTHPDLTPARRVGFAFLWDAAMIERAASYMKARNSSGRAFLITEDMD
jgi:hypothetical protein